MDVELHSQADGRERPWWLRLYGVPPWMERDVARRTRQVRWDRFAGLWLGLLVCWAACTVWGFIWLIAPLSFLTTAVAPRMKFFTKPI